MRIDEAHATSDLEGILTLQLANHLSILSPEEKATQGFITVRHTLEQLLALLAIEPQLLAKEGNEVQGYVLAMTLSSRALVPLLIPLFEQFDQLQVRGKTVSEYNPIVVGQICVCKSQRGKGLFDALYTAYRERFAATYDFAITSIALSNHRSMADHQRIGFRVLNEFEDKIQPWAIVYWDWQQVEK